MKNYGNQEGGWWKRYSRKWENCGKDLAGSPQAEKHTEVRLLLKTLIPGALLGICLMLGSSFAKTLLSPVRVERTLWNHRFTMEDLIALKKQETSSMTGLLDAAAWRYGEAGVVSETVSGRRVSAGIAYVCGTMSLAFPEKVLSGSFEREMGRKDCVISKELSFELFGAADTVGLEVKYQGKAYRVAAVIDKKEKLLLLSAREGEAQYAAFFFDARDRIKEKLQALGLE